MKNLFEGITNKKGKTDALVDTSFAFAIDQANEGIDMEQGKQAIAAKYGLEYHGNSTMDKYAQKELQPMVKDTSQRAMRITDLKKVVDIIHERCEKEGWVSTFNGSQLTPRTVNLYDLNYYLIQPSTVPKGVILRGLHHNTYKKGQIVVQDVKKESRKYQRPCGEVMEDCDGTDVLILVLKGKFGTEGNILIDNENYGSPVFVEFQDGVRMSLKELLHPEPTPPDWFISHVWGDSVVSFVERCELHAKNYCSTWTEEGMEFNEPEYNQFSYWVCAYANNQHELASEIVGSPMSSPFMTAITKSHGTLVMMDHKGSCFSRIWCDFEIFMTIMDNQNLDIVAIDENWEPFLLTEKLLPSDEDAEDKSWRDQHFPFHLLEKGMTVTLERGDASRQIDKVRILKSMVSMKSIINDEEDDSIIDWDDNGPLMRLESKLLTDEECTSYELANDALHARFAMFAWPKAHQFGCVNSFNPDSERSNGLLNKLFNRKHESTSEMNKYELDLPSITSRAALLDRFEVTLIKTTQETFINVCRGIPVNCRYVRVEFHDGEDIENEAFFCLWEKLSQLDHLVHFDMKFGNLSASHTDEMVTHPERGLAALLPKCTTLETLILDLEGDTFMHDSCLSEASLSSLGNAVRSSGPSSLHILKFDFGGWYEDSHVYQMMNQEALQTWAMDPTHLTFRTERLNHGFGNSLSSYAVHEARDGRTSRKRQHDMLHVMFSPLRYFYNSIQK